MRGNVAEDSRQRSDLQRIVRRYRDVMFRRRCGGQPDMAARLPCDLLTGPPQRLRQLRARQVARQFHAAMTSSRTK